MGWRDVHKLGVEGALAWDGNGLDASIVVTLLARSVLTGPIPPLLDFQRLSEGLSRGNPFSPAKGERSRLLGPRSLALSPVVGEKAISWTLAKPSP